MIEPMKSKGITNNKVNDLIIIFSEPTHSINKKLKIEKGERDLKSHINNLKESLEMRDMEPYESMLQKLEEKIEESLITKIENRLIIDINKKDIMVNENRKVIQRLGSEIKRMMPFVNCYNKLRTRTITLLTDNETITGYEDFEEYTRDINLIRKYMVTVKRTPNIKIGKRTIKIQIRNVLLLTGGKEIGKEEELATKTKMIHDYGQKIKETRNILSKTGGLPVTISAMAAEMVIST